MQIYHTWWQRSVCAMLKMIQTTSSQAMVQILTDEDPNKPKRTQSKPDFDSLKLTVTNLEEKRVRGDRDKSQLLKAARLKQNESK